MKGEKHGIIPLDAEQNTRQNSATGARARSMYRALGSMFCRRYHPNKCLFITKTFKFGHGITCLQSYLLRRQAHGEWMLGARLGYRANVRLTWAT